MKKKKLMEHVGKQFINSWIEQGMWMRPSDSPRYPDPTPSNSLDEHMQGVSEKAAKEESEMQKIYMKITLIEEEVLDAKKKCKKMEKRLMDSETKWDKRFEKKKKELDTMKEIIILIANYTGIAEGDTLQSISKSLKKQFFKRR